MQGVQPIRRYPLLTIANFRDLGGYVAGEDGVTRWNVFFRSARLTHATQRELTLLHELGIRTVIDLRMAEEVRRQPDACESFPGITYHHHSLIGDMSEADMAEVAPGGVPIMSTLYRQILMQGPLRFRKLMELLADGAEKGGVLFHCTAGKDRTGLTAMFLQAICGVDSLDIIAEYEVSYTYNQNFLPEDTTGSDPRNMCSLLTFLDQTYGGPIGYLKAAGVSDETMDRIRAAFFRPAEQQL